MTLKEFISKNNNKALDWDGAYGAQCVDLARFYWNDVLGINQPRGVNGAKDFWTNYSSDPNLNQNFDKIPDARELIPLKGDVMIWGASYGPWGHIAIVINGTIDDFTCFSQNDPTGAKSIIKHYSNFNGVLGVLRPKNPNNGSSEPEGTTMEIDSKTFEELVSKSSKYDEFVKAGFKDPQKVIDEKAKLDKKISDYAKTIESQDKTLFSQKEDIRKLETELAACEAQSGGETILEEIDGYEINGIKKTYFQEDKEIEVNYAVKEII